MIGIAVNMITSRPNIHSVEQLADTRWDAAFGPVRGRTEKDEETFGGRYVAAGAAPKPLEELTVLRDPTTERGFAAVLAGSPYLGEGKQAVYQCHRHLQ